MKLNLDAVTKQEKAASTGFEPTSMMKKLAVLAKSPPKTGVLNQGLVEMISVVHFKTYFSNSNPNCIDNPVVSSSLALGQ